VTDPKAARVYSGASPEEVRRNLAPLLDWDGEGLDARDLEAMIREKLVPHLMRYDSPGFQSMFNTVLEEGAALGARISLEYNQGVTNWQVSPGGATLEEMCGNALCRLFGFGPAADATFMYAGTYANQEAVYLALHRSAERLGFDLSKLGLAGFGVVSRPAVLASADAHFSVRHAVRMLGLGENGLVLVPVDRNLRMDADALRRTIAGLGPGRRAVCIVATVGTTSTGAVDPVGEIADICAEHGIWLHADGAYGLAYALTPECRDLYTGVERADSAVWDPHKQAGVPIPNSILFLRDGADFGRMALHAAYFNRPGESVPDPGLKSPPSTRMFSALALAASLRRQGSNRFIERLRSPIKAVRGLVEALSAFPDIELCHRPDTGILCFRVVLEGVSEDALDALQRSVHGRILASGERTIALTEIGGRTALRLVAVSPSVTTGALLETVEEARREARRYGPRA
jgi:L-2,4-diaminobutyrate decarboxylase